jgi:hypothetical protein
MHDSTEEGEMDDVRPIPPLRLFWSHLESQAMHLSHLSLSQHHID